MSLLWTTSTKYFAQPGLLTSEEPRKGTRQLEQLIFLEAQDILPNANIWQNCSESELQQPPALHAIAPADSAELPVHQKPTDTEMCWVKQPHDRQQ